MTVDDLVRLLRDIGYSLHLEGDNIRFRYGRDGEPPGEAASLLSMVKRNKEAVIDFLKEEPHRLIEMTLIEVNEHWEPGTLERGKRFQGGAFQTMVAIEHEVNEQAKDGNIEALTKVLNRYRSHVFGMAEAFRKAKGHEGQLFG